jgi:Fe2+ transport system protein FeoA
MGIMKAHIFSCPMCGHQFNATDHQLCLSCPLHKGCDMVCCPKCGYSTIGTRQSKLARLATGLLGLGTAIKHKNAHKNIENTGLSISLADVPPGSRAKVVGFSGDFPIERRTFLQAYGLNPNYPIDVLQHSPVTVIRVDYTELALERELAQGIQVKIIGGEK